MVQKVLEGLREEAFELARDIGVDVEGYGSLLRNSVMLFFPVPVKKLESSSRLDKSQVP